MKRRWDALKAGLLPDPALPLKQQFFEGLCLLGGLLALGVVVPMNHLQTTLNPWVNRIVILFGLELLILAWAARRAHYFKTTAFLSFVIVLDALWFPSGGSQSSIGLYFFTAVLFMVVLYKGTLRRVGFVLLVANLIGLHLAEKTWPHLAHPYGAADRLLDLSMGYVLSLLICALMLWVVLEGLNHEKGRLTESERLYRELLERQGEGFAMVDAQERFLVVNPVAETIFGVGPGQLVGRSLLEFLPPDQQEMVLSQSLLRTQGVHSTYELQVRRADGALRTLLLTVTPRSAQDGRELQAIGVFRDITERIQAEDSSRKKERYQRALLDNFPFAVWLKDTESRFLSVNAGFCRTFGATRADDLIGKNDFDIAPPELAEGYRADDRAVMETRQKKFHEEVILTGGTRTWFETYKAPVVDDDGELLGTVGFARDVSERRQADENLSYRAALLRTLLDTLPDLVWLKDADGAYLACNPRVERFFGAKEQDIVGKTDHDFVDPSLADFFRENDRRAIETGRPTTNEEQITFVDDGHVEDIETIKTPILGSDGRILGVIGIGRDITGRKQAEEANRILLQENYQSQKMDSLGSLAGGVAHDFNNMLGGIMGYADLLLIGEQDPKRLKYLRAILAAASRSAELTQKLLAFGRRGRNRIESLDLQTMVRECLELLRPSMGPDLQVVVAMEGCLRVDGDPSQVHQVLVNLCINAIEAMPERGTLTLAACPRELPESVHSGLPVPPGAYVEFSVTDTGIGMTEAVRERIFEPFFTTKNTSELSGTGLGLSTAYGILHAHGGTITVESGRGRGSTFRVLLPAGSLPPEARSPQPGSTKGHGLVLLVEDEPLLRDLGASVLDSLGYEATTASDGLEAVRIYRSRHQDFCAILLDLKMPRMAGRETFLEILKIDPGVPVIICTGYGENEEVQELLTLGAKGMLAKPYQIATLAAKLRQVTLG